jgi:hypothetical protein
MISHIRPVSEIAAMLGVSPYAVPPKRILRTILAGRGE